MGGGAWERVLFDAMVGLGCCVAAACCLVHFVLVWSVIGWVNFVSTNWLRVFLLGNSYGLEVILTREVF